MSRVPTSGLHQGELLGPIHPEAITEMAEAAASDATMMAVAGHMSRRMLEPYSHVRMATKRSALDKLESGLMGTTSIERESKPGSAN